jgi:hypothetical protein
MDDNKIFIIGANGQLGLALQRQYPNAKSADIDTLDITDLESVESFDWSNIDIVLNAAAFTNVDGAETEEMIARQYPGCQLVFANGGDRSAPEVVPERDVCEKYNIEMVYGVGGSNKADSSTRINQATGQES